MERRLPARASAGTVTFDVGGHHFKVLRKTIEARPDTLLASLVDDIGTDSSEPIFVDANPDRFGHILDWYRYNEMYVQEFIVGAVLRDAKFFLLPDVVRVNGTSHVIGSSQGGIVCEEVLMATKAEWPTCDQYVEDTIRELRQHFENHLRDARQRFPTLGYTAENKLLDIFSTSLFPDKTIHVFDAAQRNPWLDSQNLSDFRRMWRLIAELRQKGFKCRLGFGYRLEGRFYKYKSIALHVGLGLIDFLSIGGPLST